MSETAVAARTRRPERVPLVLFVDDEPQVLEGLAAALRKKPLRMVTATSGAQALELLRQHRVDVLVSDEQMPGMRGSELLAAARITHPRVLRILLTGQASLEAAIRAINEGEVWRLLTKPCPAPDLLQTIQHGMLLRDLAEQSALLAAKARRQRAQLRGLEQRFPGISRLEQDRRGAVVIGERELLSLIEELEELKGGPASSEAAAEGP
jgi:two-component system, probable response regulator PhcQ